MTRTSRTNGIRAILFDLDGTLIDTVGLILASMRYSTRRVLGIEIPDADLMLGVGTPLDDQMRVFSAEHADELVRVYRRHNDEVHDDMIRGYPGIEEALEEISARGIPMGIVTSKSRCAALQGIETFGLERFFSTIVCADDVERHKPDPLPLLAAADALGIPAEQTMYVGDSPYDILAAKAAGSVSVGVSWGVFSGSELEKSEPDHIIHRVEDLLVLVEGIEVQPTGRV